MNVYRPILYRGAEAEIEMDFHKLSRRELQALCKKNQITANGTNIAMADALASLQHVEGLDEFLSPPELDVTLSPETEKAPTTVNTRSMTRASTRRRTILETETEKLPSRTTARLTARNRNAAAVAADKERKVLNFNETPVVSRIKKGTESLLVKLKEVQEKIEGEKNDEGDVLADGTVNTVEKTRRGKTRATVTQSTIVYTRRSTRLLEKKMNDLKLSDEVIRDLEPIKMSELTAEKDLSKDLKDATKNEHPSESFNEDSKAEVVACEVESPVEVVSEIEEETESHLTDDIYGKKEIIAAESDVDASVEVENDKKTIDSQVMAEVQNEKIIKVDESLVGQLQEGPTSVEEAANGYGLHASPSIGNDISELTAQVTSLNLNYLKNGCNKDVHSGEVEKTVVPDDTYIVLDGYLADSDAVFESTLKVVKSLIGDGELKIHGDALSKQSNNPIANSAGKMDLCNNIGQLFDVGVTEEELAMESSRNQKSAETETVNVQIVNGACEEDISSTKTPASIKKASKVHLSPLLIDRLTELSSPLKSSNYKIQPKDENKENVVGEGVEFGNNILPGLPAAVEDIQGSTPLKEKSLGQLKKLVKKKIQEQSDKRIALQMVQGNNSMAVAGEKDD